MSGTTPADRAGAVSNKDVNHFFRKRGNPGRLLTENA